MDIMVRFLLFLFVFNNSPTWARNARTSRFCNRCQQRCENTDLITTGGTRVGNAGSTESRGYPWVVSGRGWTVFQRRMNGDVNFYRGWDDYVNGFGHLQGDHWLGLEAMHQMTKRGNMKLKIKMITRDGIYRVAKYSYFRIGPGSDRYRLHVSGFSGNATGDGLLRHDNFQFSTKDADHDAWSSVNCASHHEGGWWYDRCAWSNLNGNFNKTGSKQGFWWYGYSSSSDSLRFSEMKIRKRSPKEG